MLSCIYNTSPSWIETLRAKGIRSNVNFWRKDLRALNLAEGAPFYFKVLGAAQVAGRGFFRESVNMTAASAWERFGLGNGYTTEDAFRAGITDMLGVQELTPESQLSCLVLDGLEWLDSPVMLPRGFFPQGVLGAKFYEEDEIAFIASVFSGESLPGTALSPIVLFEAEATVDDAFEWRDQTGERYHFPNQYRNRVLPGRRFVYYRGVRRQDGSRGPAEYFGRGRIGEVWLDPQSAGAPRKTDRAWFSAIEEYEPFDRPVSSALGDGRYYENITHARGWQVGVRVVTEDVYAAILAAAGVNEADAQAPPDLPMDAVVLREATNLLRPRVRVQGDGGRGNRTQAYRRSRRATAIGRRAEELVRQLLHTRFQNVRWLSVEGELPGYDFAYDDEGVGHAVEVKGTTGRHFPAIELTVNEWRAAEALGDRFWLYLVTQCESTQPCVQVIQNPAALLAAGTASLQPLVLRFELHAPLVEPAGRA